MRYVSVAIACTMSSVINECKTFQADRKLIYYTHVAMPVLCRWLAIKLNPCGACIATLSCHQAGVSQPLKTYCVR